MAFGNGIIFEVQTGGSDSANGGGFDPGATMATDLAATSATGSAPVVTSASYNFAAGDVGAYLFVKSGTNWVPGWYPIASVASNAATLTATSGTVILYNGQTTFSTANGCASTASPTGGTWSIDYSRSTTPPISYVDMAIDGTTNTKFTSTGIPVGPNIVGNTIRVTSGTGFTVQTVEVLSVSGTTATCDKSLGTLSSTGGHGGLGGALASPGGLGALTIPSTCSAFVAAGTYAMSATSNVSGGRLTWNGRMFCGYSTNRIPFNSDTRPVFKPAANSMSVVTLNGSNQFLVNIDVENPDTKTTVVGITNAQSPTVMYRCTVKDCKSGITNGQAQNFLFQCTVINATDISNGAIQVGAQSLVHSCTTINSPNGIQGGGTTSFAVDCVVAGNAGTGPGYKSFGVLVNCVAHGITGSGVSGYDSTSVHVNCIASTCTGSGSSYGYLAGTSGMQCLTNCAAYNCSTNINATNLVSSVVSGLIALSATPFVSAGTTTSADFTLNSTAGAGALLQSASTPSAFPGLASTTYVDMGAIQRQASGGGGGGGGATSFAY